MGVRRLSAQDANFIYGEDERIPLHVGVLGLLDAAPLRDARGRVDIAGVREALGSRLHRIPILRQRLAHVPFEQGRPVWIDHEEFRVEDHVRLRPLAPPGGRRELLRLMGLFQASLLDRRRPLWEIHLVDGLAGGDRVALIAKIHHAVIDGAAGVALAQLLFDAEPHPVRETPPTWQPTPAPGPLGLMAEAWASNTRDVLGVLRTAADALRHPRHTYAGAISLARTLETLLSGFDPLPWNAPVGPRRAFETLTLPLAEVLDARRRFQATVNELVLAAVAGAIRRYCAAHDQDPDELLRIKAICPVDTRAPGDTEPGTQVSAIVVQLPVDEPDPEQRIARVRECSQGLKACAAARGAEVWARVGGVLPATVLRAASHFQFRGLMANANLMLSNVRGPQQPLYCLGARVEAFYPYFGVQDGVGLNLVLLSYHGRLLVGIAADPDLVPDLGAFAECVRKSFAEIARAV